MHSAHLVSFLSQRLYHRPALCLAWSTCLHFDNQARIEVGTSAWQCQLPTTTSYCSRVGNVLICQVFSSWASKALPKVQALRNGTLQNVNESTLRSYLSTPGILASEGTSWWRLRAWEVRPLNHASSWRCQHGCWACISTTAQSWQLEYVLVFLTIRVSTLLHQGTELAISYYCTFI